MASKAITLNDDKLITLELLRYYHGKTLAQIKEIIDKQSEVAISSEKPTGENVKFWVDTSETSTINIPEINDTTTSAVDTWSSDQISKHVSKTVEDEIAAAITENLMTVEDVDRMFEEATI